MPYCYEQQAYFANLPKLIQESIMQSGIDFQSEKQLREFVDQLQKG